MIRIGPGVVLAALAVLLAGSAYAQSQRVDPAVPRALPDQRLEPSGELVQPSPRPIPPRIVSNARRAQHDADARQCLTLATNRAVHRCAERYRSHATRANAKAVKTTAKAPAAAARSMDTAKPADVLKPGAARPEDTARAAELVKPMDVTRPGGTPKPVDSTAKAPEAAKPGVTAPSAPAAKPAAPAAKSAEPAKK